MSEAVTVTPRFERDDDGNPVDNGAPVTLEAFAVAPGNSTIAYTQAGDVDTVAFTVFFNEAQDINDGDLITVRGKPCNARTQLWENPYHPHGGFVVLAEAITGAA
jgi:hypothetical protein